jgi:Flp pilus assembly protein TadD
MRNVMRHLLHVSFDLLPRVAVKRFARLFFPLAIIGLVILLALRSASDPLAETLAQGDQALAAGRPEEALHYYQQAAALPAGAQPAAIHSAQAKLALARQAPDDPTGFVAARDAWQDAARIQGEVTPQIHRGLGASYMGLGELLLAAEHLELAYTLDPSEPALWEELAPALLQAGHWEPAARAYAHLASLTPGDAQFNYWAGALQLSADPALAHSHLMLALADPLYASRTQELLAALQELEDLSDPARVAARAGLAYLAIDEPRLAEWLLSAAADAQPGLADVWAYLGLAQDQLGSNGRPSIARAVELAPDSPLAHSIMGHHWMNRDRPDLARPEFVTAHDLDPDNPAHLADVASTYQLEGDFYSAQAWYQGAVRQAPEDPAFWVLLALFYVDALGDAPQGLLAAQRAVALAPEDPAALDALGWAQFRDGQLRLAETNLLAACQRSPADPAIHYHLGKLADQQGQWDQAQAAYEEAIALAATCKACPAPAVGWYGQLAQRELDAR